MIDIEKLAIEYLACQKSKIDGGLPVFCGNKDILEAFAKAYLDEWLKEQEVIATCLGNKAYLHRIPFVGTKLIALPSEVK